MKKIYSKKNMTTEILLKRNLRRHINTIRRNTKKFLKEDDPEALHDLRVSLRKLRTVLKLLSGLYDDFYTDIIRKELKDFFERTNRSRDIEVSLALIEKLQLTKKKKDILNWYNRKKETEKNLKSELKDYLKRNPLNKTLKLLNALMLFPPKIKDGTPVEELLFKKIRKTEDRIRKTISEISDNFESDPVRLHRLRILCKRLRYSLEFLEPVFSLDYRNRIKVLKKMQTSMGNLNDLHIIRDIVINDKTLSNNSKMILTGILDDMKTQYAAEIRDAFGSF